MKDTVESAPIASRANANYADLLPKASDFWEKSRAISVDRLAEEFEVSDGIARQLFKLLLKTHRSRMVAKGTYRLLERGDLKPVLESLTERPAWNEHLARATKLANGEGFLNTTVLTKNLSCSSSTASKIISALKEAKVIDSKGFLLMSPEPDEKPASAMNGSDARVPQKPILWEHRDNIISLASAMGKSGKGKYLFQLLEEHEALLNKRS